MTEEKKQKPKKEDIKKDILKTLLNNPKTITQIGKELRKDKNNIGKYIKEMKDMVKEEEFIKKGHGRCKLVKLKKKAYDYLGVNKPVVNTYFDEKKETEEPEENNTDTFINEEDERLDMIRRGCETEW